MKKRKKKNVQGEMKGDREEGKADQKKM